MSRELYEWRVAYWEESPANNAGEKKTKNDNNKEHASMACRELSVRKAKNDNNKEHASTACREASVISIDPEVSLVSVTEDAASTLPSGAMNELSRVSMSSIPVNRRLDYGGTSPRGHHVLQLKAHWGHSRNMQPNARPFFTRKRSADPFFTRKRSTDSIFTRKRSAGLSCARSLPDQGIAIS